MLGLRAGQGQGAVLTLWLPERNQDPQFRSPTTPSHDGREPWLLVGSCSSVILQDSHPQGPDRPQWSRDVVRLRRRELASLRSWARTRGPSTWDSGAGLLGPSFRPGLHVSMTLCPLLAASASRNPSGSPQVGSGAPLGLIPLGCTHWGSCDLLSTVSETQHTVGLNTTCVWCTGSCRNSERTHTSRERRCHQRIKAQSTQEQASDPHSRDCESPGWKQMSSSEWTAHTQCLVHTEATGQWKR